MERITNIVPGPIRRIISRGLSFPTLPVLSRYTSSNGDQTPLPSAGKRQREASDDEGENGPAKRVKMDVDTPLPAVSETPETPGAVEQIRPGVEALSLAAGTPEPANGSPGKATTSSPGTPSKKGKYQRGLRGTRKSAGNETPAPSKPRLGPKRQCALLISFCGTGYSGMQIQKDAKTIEGSLFDALVKVGAVSEDNSDDATKVNIQRSARTDAGVHAARNLVSIKIINEIPGVTDLVGKINENLPPEIHVWDIIRTQNSFSARTNCDSRKYTYCFPTYMLIPPAPDSLVGKALRAAPDAPYNPSQHAFWKDVAGKPITPESTLFSLRQKYHADEETVEIFKAILEKFVGTHNFWNFTVGREFKEAAAQRHIKSIDVRPPANYGNGEWLAVEIHGQSFMLHQIRKMIALAIFVTRSQGSPSLVENLYTSTRVRIPKAPALGLLLEEPVFEGYNKKITTANAKWKDAATAGGKDQEEDNEHAQNFIREPMDFSKFKDEIEKFKDDHIYAALLKQEDEQGSFETWLDAIDSHEARLFYEVRGLPVPSDLGGTTKPGSTRSAAAKIDDGDESDDALGKGKVNYKSADLEG